MDHIKSIKGLLNVGNLTEFKYYCLNHNIVAEDFFKENDSFDILTYAIEKNVSVEIIDFICSLYKNINYELPNGKIPLFYAISKSKFAIASVLLKNHADINFSNSEGNNVTFFLHHIDKLTPKRLRFLINNGIDIYYRDAINKTIIYYINDKDSKPILNMIINEYVYNNDFILSLISMGKKGVSITKTLFSNKVYNQVEKFDIFTLPYYKMAIYWRNLDILEFFAICCNRAFECYFPINGNDILRDSIILQNVPVVKYILNNDLYNITEFHEKNRIIENISQEPLILAITVNNPTLVKLLIDAKFDVNLKINDRMNPLSFACIVDNIEIVKMLLKAGAKINKYYYFVELPIAARNGNFKLVKLLLETFKKQQGFDKRLSVNSLKLKFKWNTYYHKNYQQQQEKYHLHIHEQLQVLNSNNQNKNESDIKNSYTLSQYQYQFQKQQKQIYIYGNCLYAAIYALTSGHKDIYDYLMGYSDYYSKDNLIYKVPMVIALTENNLNILKYLTRKGIPLRQTFNFKVSLSNNIVKSLSPSDNTPLEDDSLISLERTSLLHYSTWKKEYAIVQYLLNEDCDVNYQCEKGYTALMIATKNNDIRMVNLLVANGANINLKDKEGMCPLLIACLNGYVVLVKYLIDSGGDINVKSKYNENMLLLSYQLSIGNDRFIVERYDKRYLNIKGARPYRAAFEHMVNYLLINNIDITVTDINRISTVDYAIVNNRVSDARYFLNHGANPNCQFNELDLLKYVILKNWLLMVRLLIKSGADIERSDKYYNTPLTCAVRAGSIDILKELVEAGVNLNTRDNKGYTPLIFAVRRKNLPIINYLIEQGVDVNEKDNEGFTALMHAIITPNYSMNIIQSLVDNGADLNSINNRHLTPLLIAAKINSYEIARYLVIKGAHINDIDNRGRNALMLAILNHNIELVNFLIDKGISLNERNYEDYTALMIASENGYINIVKALVEHGADISIKSKKQTAAKLASRKRHFEIVNYLVTRVAV